VHIVDTDGMGPFERVQRYDAAGRLVFGTTRLTYDGSGREYLTWDGPRLVGIDSYYAQGFRRGYCDVEGGCDEPATRTIDHTSLSYDDGRLTDTDRRTLEFGHGDRGAWMLHDRRRYRDKIAYDGDRLVRFRGDIRWANGHPVERRNGKFESTFEWAGGRLAVYRWSGFTQAFAYDDRGRLASERMTGPNTDTTTTWSYDDAGRLASRVATESSRPYEWTWTYDAGGRVVRSTGGPATSTVYTYGASCPANLNAPALPTAPGRAGLVACARSPGDLYNTCDN
jgi:YD repeat-containing protein